MGGHTWDYCSRERGSTLLSCWRVPISRNSVFSSFGNRRSLTIQCRMSSIHLSIVWMASVWENNPSAGLKLRYNWESSTEIAHMGKDSTHRRARISLWWPGMNKQLKQVIDICEVCNAFHTKNQQTLVKIWVWYFFSGPLSGFSWLLWTCHRLAPGVGPLANQLQENMSGNPS